MEKVRYRFVYNRSGNLCVNGTALIQIEAYQDGKRKYLSTNIYIKPNQWNRACSEIRNHPNATGLNMMLYDARNKLEAIEIELWRNGQGISLDILVNLARMKVLNSAVNQGVMTRGQNPFNTMRITHDNYHSTYL